MGITGRGFHLRRQVQLSYYQIRRAAGSLWEQVMGLQWQGLRDQFTVEETWLRGEVSFCRS